MRTGYAETYRRSLERPEEFWAQAAEAIDWERRWDRVLDTSTPPFFRWFAGGRLNTCWNALDRHVAAGRGERVALIWDSPVTGQIVRFSYRALRDRSPRRGAFGRVRRLRLARARDADRRRQAGGNRIRLLRHRDRPHHPVQAAARRGDRRSKVETRCLRRIAAADVPGRTRARPRSRLGGTLRRRQTGRLRAGVGDRPALYPLHL